MYRHDQVADFRSLKQQVGIGQILSHYRLDTHLRRTGDSLSGPCPLHGGDNPTAFRVDLRRGLWHCWTACGGGDIVDLVRRVHRCSYAEAGRHLARIAAIPPASPPAATTPPHPTPAAAPHRGFRPFVRTLMLDPHVPFLQEHKRIHVATAIRFETGRPVHSVFLRGTVAVRLHDPDGHPLGYCGRRLDPADVRRWGKWRFPAAFPKSETLYNAHRARRHRCRGIVVTECPWAVMRLAQAGIPGAVALLGTSASRAHIAWLDRAPAVLLMLDGDRPGRAAARSIARLLSRSTQVHVYDLPEHHDPDDLSDSELRRVVHAHLPFSLNP